MRVTIKQKKKMKWTKLSAIIGTILIVVAIGAKLSGFGCKDEADANKMQQKVSLDFIPTWPDYIELEKELWITDDSEYGVLIRLIKGTKIYFKED